MSIQSQFFMLGAVAALAACSASPVREDDMSSAAAADNSLETASSLQSSAVTHPTLPAPQTAADPELADQRLIYFDFDRTALLPEFESRLDSHADYLKAHPDVAVRLEGHADERGTREYNIALGERRAREVRKALLLRGVYASQIEMTSYGEERPAVIGQTELSYARNRRVEFHYLSGAMAGAPLSFELPDVASRSAQWLASPRHDSAGSAAMRSQVSALRQGQAVTGR